MSENNLKIRGKFINKLSSKIEDLNNNFILLSKVDKKILKKINNQISENINNQKGGDPNAANNAILAALKKSLQMKKQQQSLTDSLEQLKSIQKVIDSFNNTFGSIKKIIDNIQLSTFPIVNNLNRFVASDINTLTSEEINRLTIILNDSTKNYKSLEDFEKDNTPELTKKIGESGFNILFTPNTTDEGDTKTKEEAVAETEAESEAESDAENEAEANAIANRIVRQAENADTEEFLRNAEADLANSANPRDAKVPIKPDSLFKKAVNTVIGQNKGVNALNDMNTVD